MKIALCPNCIDQFLPRPMVGVDMKARCAVCGLPGFCTHADVANMNEDDRNLPPLTALAFINRWKEGSAVIEHVCHSVVQFKYRHVTQLLLDIVAAQDAVMGKLIQEVKECSSDSQDQPESEKTQPQSDCPDSTGPASLLR